MRRPLHATSASAALLAPTRNLSEIRYGDNRANEKGVVVSAEQLRACSRKLAAGVTVVTTCDPAGHPYGLTMSAVVCLSLEPALFLICIGETSNTLSPLLERGAFVINVLGRDQEALARTFASKGQAEKFAHVDYHLSAHRRLPVLANAVAVMECRLVDTYPGGDHRIVVGEIETVCTNPGQPLVYYDGRFLTVKGCSHSIGGAAGEIFQANGRSGRAK